MGEDVPPPPPPPVHHQEVPAVLRLSESVSLLVLLLGHVLRPRPAGEGVVVQVPVVGSYVVQLVESLCGER